MRFPLNGKVVAAIDVGSNAVRLELVRRLPDGSRESLHQERDPVRPGEGVFKTGRISPVVADRLIATLRRYGALCRRHHAQVRAVATSALREAKNRDEIIRRARKEAGLRLEVVSGTEEARLTCLSVLEGRPASARSLCIDIGGGSTEVATAKGEHPTALFSIALGALRLTEAFAHSSDAAHQLTLMRDYAREAVERALPASVPGMPRTAIGSSGSIRGVIRFAALDGTGHVTLRQLRRTVDELAAMSPAERRRHFEPNRASTIVAGAVILEAVMLHLKLEAVTAVDRGLRQGILIDLLKRQDTHGKDTALAEAAIQLGLHFRFDRAHAEQVSRVALFLFDHLTTLHGLPDSARSFLEAAALLHDIGNSISYGQHHKHTYYLLTSSDISGLSDREKEIVARIARYHRRSPPETKHSGMGGLASPERRLVRKLATLLRVADSLDRSHHQLVQQLTVTSGRSAVTLRLKTNAPADLELWDVAHEAPLFRQVFGRRLIVKA
jgi:exopolyphosphatase/guanosine-5'-triphosphate,3'-diphosphate pyrophosphatase